ncbi:immunity repressor [Gordonia phage Powerball]|uniref:Immunity repressor n=1 Tax=Gordonia phage Powerball TaxID=2599847 RepID=A0A5J6TRR9_9CAUD|nr:immunity repressor [Gordonia phage Powerball]QFG13473.1 immunity repressor [Gordonia phage Powerball]
MGDVKTPALWSLIQAHLDEYGVTDAEFARRMGVSPQTLNSWKKRGVRQLPSRDKLESVAELTRNTYAHVLDAALVDAGYKDQLRAEVVEVAQRIRDLGVDYWDALDDLIEELRKDYYERLAAQRPKLSDLIGDDPTPTSRASGEEDSSEKTGAAGRRNDDDLMVPDPDDSTDDYDLVGRDTGGPGEAELIRRQMDRDAERGDM